MRSTKRARVRRPQARLRKGSSVTTPHLKIKGKYTGLSKKGHGVSTTRKGRKIIVYTKDKPILAKKRKMTRDEESLWGLF